MYLIIGYFNVMSHTFACILEDEIVWSYFWFIWTILFVGASTSLPFKNYSISPTAVIRFLRVTGISILFNYILNTSRA